MTNTIPTFNPTEYVAAIDSHMQWMQLGEGLKQNPYDPRLRQTIGAMQYGDPNSLLRETPDVLQSYANANASDLLRTVQGTTIAHSKKILTDIVNGFDNPGQAIDLVLGAELMPFEGDDRYKSTTAAHKSVMAAQAIIQGKNVAAAAGDIIGEYEFGQSVQEAVRYHANANPNGLLNIYASSVLSAKVQKFAQEFARKEDGALKKKHLIDYAQYAFENARDQSKPAQAIAGIAYGTYKN